MKFADYSDNDPIETQEWREALDAVIDHKGNERAQYLLKRTVDHAYLAGVNPVDLNRSPYLNTIPVHREKEYPGNQEIEHNLRSMIRWNAMAMVVRANKKPAEPGGHIASFQSSATMYNVGFHHFWRAPTDDHGGDMVFVQGHVAPGIYSRAFVEGRLTEEQLDNFRIEAGGKGISSYPHPWLMPDFWQFPTVSMGLGPIMAIYQARFMKYMENRGFIDAKDRKVWAFLGDGETDEPESQGALALATRENLDNLIFVVNCNLQRLDGPVRGNGKIIQELEGNFRGAGWNVIKLIWGAGWDKLLAQDHNGLLRKRMQECVDGDYQTFKSKDGAYVREHFFGKYPELKKMVEHMSDEEIYFGLNRGGHDPKKVYNAFDMAFHSEGKPTVILSKTVKGYGMGEAGEGQNITHNQKKVGEEHLKVFAKRFDIPLSEEQIHNLDFIRPDEGSAEHDYLHARRKALGGYLPSRKSKAEPLSIPDLADIFSALLSDTGERTMSTTMALVRILVAIARNKEIGSRLVPIVPDEARTFGMEGMFRQVGIYSPKGQTYTPQDAEQIMPYKEDTKGQMLQEGINEAGAVSSWIAAATSYSNHGIQMLPVYIFYSMFGFQRIGDFAWAAGDSRARGFLVGGTAGRTTLNGEGLQHEDGHSHLFANFIPNCRSYDPTYHYELATIFQHGMKEMFEEQNDVFYYLTTMNENYSHPEMPKGSEEGIIKGMYKLKASKSKGKKVNLLGSGTILRECEAAAELLESNHGVAADIWSVTSYNELYRDGHEALRWNRLHPTSKKKRSNWVADCLSDKSVPTISSTDYLKLYSEQIRPFVPGVFQTLGTDGYGRSDSRAALRSHFEVDRYHICIAALTALAEQGDIKVAEVAKAIKKYDIDVDKPNPLYA